METYILHRTQMVNYILFHQKKHKSSSIAFPLDIQIINSMSLKKQLFRSESHSGTILQSCAQIQQRIDQQNRGCPNRLLDMQV
jgi:hypothetical protein